MVITTAVITPARPSRRQPIRFATATVDYSFDSTARAARDATLDEADAAIDGVLADYPAVQLHDRDELRTQGDAGVDAGLRVFYGVFGLIVAIALFGIVNTLTLSIVERVHEVGLLRAIGLDPADVRSMVRAESIILATFGVIVGVGLGIVFVWAMMSTASPGSDLDLDLTIPIWQLVIIAASAVVAAVVAAIPPSIHASRGRRPASDHHRMTTRTAESGTEVTSPSQESPAHPASPLVGSRDARKPLSTAAGGCTIRLSRWPCG